MNGDLQKLHNVLLEILDYVVLVCEKNGLTYFLAYGTALGAYRHKGFIPWDDDLDIVMPRDDYEKFRSIMHQKTDEEYCIQDELNEEKYFLTFCKIRKKNTVFIEELADGLYENNGIYIDIFPLDSISETRFMSVKIRNYIISYWRHVLKFMSCTDVYRNKESKVSFFLDSLICLPRIWMNNKRILAHVQNLMVGRNINYSNYLAQYDQVANKAILEREVYYPPIELEFEGKKYSCPHQIERYLSSQYGDDYMTIPPIEERQTHKPIRLKF